MMVPGNHSEEHDHDVSRSMLTDEVQPRRAAYARERASEAQLLSPQSTEEIKERTTWREIRRAAASRRLRPQGVGHHNLLTPAAADRG